MGAHWKLDPEIQAHYALGGERGRLFVGGETLEYARTRDILSRFLPPPPAAILDVGGGAGAYASWLARGGYQVHLIDAMPLHVAQAQEAAARQPEHPFTAALGDARRLAEADASVDAVLLLGPLYHLTERPDRIAALREAYRVARPGGLVLAAGISRFAPVLDGLRKGFLADPLGASMVERTLRDGQHRNPDIAGHPEWFTTAFFHRPDDLAAEVSDAGLQLETLLGIEGPGWILTALWDDSAYRPYVIEAARAVEREPSLLGASAHLMAIGRKTAPSVAPAGQP